MKNKIFIFLITFSGLCSIYISFKFNSSLQQQSLLIYEFNKYSITTPLGLIETFNDEFPSITNTTLPISTLIGKYYLRDSMVNTALKYFHKGKSQNKYIGISEFELAKHYYNANELDSAYYYSKIAFNKLPRNVLYTNMYFKTLSKLKLEAEIDSSFLKVKSFQNFGQWANYIYTKLEVNPESKEELKKTLNELKTFDGDSPAIKTMESIINVGYENLDELTAIVVNAEELFQKGEFFNAGMLELRASNLDPLEYVHLENAAISFYKANEFQLAEKTFIQVMDDFPNRLNGKTEFYYGVMKIELGDTQKGCEYLSIANQRIYAGAKQVIDLYCGEK